METPLFGDASDGSGEMRKKSRKVKITRGGNPTSRPIFTRLYGMAVGLILTLGLLGVVIFLKKAFPKASAASGFEAPDPVHAAVSSGLQLPTTLRATLIDIPTLGSTVSCSTYDIPAKLARRQGHLYTTCTTSYYTVTPTPSDFPTLQLTTLRATLLLPPSATAAPDSPSFDPCVSTWTDCPVSLDGGCITYASSIEGCPETSYPDTTPTVTDPGPSPTITDSDPSPTISDLDASPTITDPEASPTITDPDSSPTVSESDPTPTITEPDTSQTISDPDPTPTITNPDPSPTISDPDPSPTLDDDPCIQIYRVCSGTKRDVGEHGANLRPRSEEWEHCEMVTQTAESCLPSPTVTADPCLETIYRCPDGEFREEPWDGCEPIITTAAACLPATITDPPPTITPPPSITPEDPVCYTTYSYGCSEYYVRALGRRETSCQLDIVQTTCEDSTTVSTNSSSSEITTSTSSTTTDILTITDSCLASTVSCTTIPYIERLGKRVQQADHVECYTEYSTLDYPECTSTSSSSTTTTTSSTSTSSSTSSTSTSSTTSSSSSSSTSSTSSSSSSSSYSLSSSSSSSSTTLPTYPSTTTSSTTTSTSTSSASTLPSTTPISSSSTTASVISTTSSTPSSSPSTQSPSPSSSSVLSTTASAEPSSTLSGSSSISSLTPTSSLSSSTVSQPTVSSATTTGSSSSIITSSPSTTLPSQTTSSPSSAISQSSQTSQPTASVSAPTQSSLSVSITPATLTPSQSNTMPPTPSPATAPTEAASLSSNALNQKLPSTSFSIPLTSGTSATTNPSTAKSPTSSPPQAATTANPTTSPTSTPTTNPLNQRIIWPTWSAPHSLPNHIPILASRVFVLLFAPMYSQLLTHEPVRLLLSPGGASGSALFGPSFGAPHIGLLTAQIGSAFSAGALVVDTNYCGLAQGTNNLNPCPPRMSVTPWAMDVVLVCLVVQVVVIVYAASKWFQKPSGLSADPTTIAGVAAVMGHPEIERDFSSFPAEMSDKELKERIKDRKFRLGMFMTESGRMKYGIVPGGMKESKFRRGRFWEKKKRRSSTGGASKASWLRDWKQNRLYTDLIFAAFLLALLGLTAAALARVDRPQTVFLASAAASGTGMKIFFAALGIIVSFYWGRLFQDAQTFTPYLPLQSSAPPNPTILLSRHSNPLTALPPLLRNRHFAAASIALTGLLAELLIVALSGLPYRPGQLRSEFLFSSISALVIVGLMIAQLVVVNWWRRLLPHLPRRPDGIAAVMTYTAGTGMVRDFCEAGVEARRTRERDRIVGGMGKRYAYRRDGREGEEGRWVVDEVGGEGRGLLDGRDRV